MRPRFWNIVWGAIFILMGISIAGAVFGWWAFVMWKLIFPAILIVIGVQIIRGHNHNGHYAEQTYEEMYRQAGTDKPRYEATFSGQTIQCDNQVFEGVVLEATFGSLRLRLDRAIINQDVTIYCNVTFGAVEVFLPSDVNVQVQGTPVFGGINNQRRGGNLENAPVVTIVANCSFGGVEIR